MGRRLAALILGSCLWQDRPARVTATVETDPVPSGGDAADDPAVWLHPGDPSKSTIIGTDKQAGLAVYRLDGTQVQYLPDGEMNNVDVRYGFPLGGKKVDLVTAGDRGANVIAAYRVDPGTGKLENVAGRPLKPGISIYGSCMYRSPKTGKFYAFVCSYSGEVEQWELFDGGRGKVDGRKARAWKVSSSSEGCVADDDLGCFYLGEERVGIWKYGAEPGDGTAAPRKVDACGRGGRLSADVEGLAIYCLPDGTGYLLASSQGNDSFAVYRREGNNDYLFTFKIEDGAVDGAADTDGIDVLNANLGPLFPKGVFVVQDGYNGRENQNFKLVPWERIAAAGGTPLKVDTSWDPRKR